MEFKDRLRALRILNGYTQEQLAKKLSLSKANISKYESGIIEPNLKTLELLSKTFKCTVDYLLDIEKQQCDYSFPIKPIRERIVDIMHENNLTKNDFAKITEVKPYIVDYWLNGDLPIGEEQQLKIYDYFKGKYSLNFLFQPNGFDDFTEQEKEVIASYRNTPEMQSSVNKLLGIDTIATKNIGEDIAETVSKTQETQYKKALKHKSTTEKTHIIKNAARNGSYKELALNDEELEELQRKINSLPEATDL